MRFAIVDIETTGGSPSRHRITEIAVVLMEDGEVLQEWQTLVNPEKPIPPRIVRLNGLTDELVQDAPTFEEVADQFNKLTEGAVFVAHNVNFDYAFLRNAFNRIKGKFTRKKLCTVRLARKLVPGLSSYGLDRLCSHFNIGNEQRHRALGDAKATAHLFAKLQELDQGQHISAALNRLSREAVLPPNLPREQFDDLPKALGVYFFYDVKGKLLYVGKAKNIRSRVSSHFSYHTNTQNKHRFVQQIYEVKYELAGSELFAHLLEVHTIKKHWPPFNRSMKRIRLNYGVFTYYDRNGFGRFAVAETSKTNRGTVSFRYYSDAWYCVEQLMKNHQLCKQLCGLDDPNHNCAMLVEQCKGKCLNQEEVALYNLRYQQALTELTSANSSYFVKGKGRTEDEVSIAYVERGRYKGWGYVPAATNLQDVETVKDYLQSGYDDQDVQYLLQSHLNKYPEDRIVLTLPATRQSTPPSQ